MAQASMAANPALKDTYVQLKTRMDKAVEDFRREMAATRTGRANVHMLDTVSVDYYGEQMPLNQVSTDSRAGAADDHGAAVRHFADGDDRKSDSWRAVSGSIR